MLGSGNFWIGVVVGIALYFGWNYYQAKKAAQG